MSQPIGVGDQVIGMQDGWNGTIGTVESFDRDWADTMSITINYTTLPHYHIGDSVRVLQEQFQRYMP